jgi:hypothetical protein
MPLLYHVIPVDILGIAEGILVVNISVGSLEYIRLIFAYTLGMSRYDRPSHQVYMYFFKRGGWQVQFTEADLKTPLPRKLTFTDPEKIRELAKRGEAWGDSESRQMLEHAIETGRGGVYLRLTPEQYAKLRRA